MFYGAERAMSGLPRREQGIVSYRDGGTGGPDAGRADCAWEGGLRCRLPGASDLWKH